tara:strand:+ start:490 stop:675 length:186 start_codon:yes stop_codon:yes gene_type:complete
MHGKKKKGMYLKGGQVQLDMNKDGKISGDDFAMMRKKKKAAYGMKMKSGMYMTGGRYDQKD